MSEQAPGCHVGTVYDNSGNTDNIGHDTTDSTTWESGIWLGQWVQPMCLEACTFYITKGKFWGQQSLWPWESSRTFLSFSFPVCKMGSPFLPGLCKSCGDNPWGKSMSCPRKLKLPLFEKWSVPIPRHIHLQLLRANHALPGMVGGFPGVCAREHSPGSKEVICGEGDLGDPGYVPECQTHQIPYL